MTNGRACRYFKFKGTSYYIVYWVLLQPARKGYFVLLTCLTYERASLHSKNERQPAVGFVQTMPLLNQ